MNYKRKSIKNSPEYSGIILCISFLIIYFIIQFIRDPQNFFSIRTYNSFMSIFKSYTPLILVTMGQALLMLLGIIDISIGIQMSFANVLAVMLPVWLNIPTGFAWILVLIVSIGISTLNGVIISYLRIPPLLEGFAMIYVIKGINLLIMPKPGGQVDMTTNKIYDHMLFGMIPVSLIIIIVCYIIWKLLSLTNLINHVYAIGGNERNAYATGINIEKTKIKIYAISGLFTGIAGLCYTAAYTTGNPITGEIYGLQSISACIIGGISLAGGWGNMACALYGIGFQLFVLTSVPKVFAMISKSSGTTFNTYWHNLVSDSIILLGLIVTIIVVKSQRKTIIRGISKQIKAGGNSE